MKKVTVLSMAILVSAASSLAGATDQVTIDAFSSRQALQIEAVQIASGLTQPVSLATPPGDTERLFVVEKKGRIRIVDVPSGTVLPDAFLDIRDRVSSTGERGLLGIAFDPQYPTSGFFYISYNQLDTGTMTISRFAVSDDPNIADEESEIVIKVIPHELNAHNGGQLRFGPDGYLYFSAGDGSTANDADSQNNSQNLMILHGKVLRLDVNRPPDYIPPSNPFVDNPKARDEIWALGLRQPWRFSFDRETGDLYIGDVGWGDWEEIDFQPAESLGGENYGWRCMEGSSCTGLEGCTCNDPDLALPIYEMYHHSGDGTCAVIGGFVYRGCAIPEMMGRYLYADYCGDYVRSFRVVPDGKGGWMVADEIDLTLMLDPDGVFGGMTTFGEDADGELYLTGMTGDVWKIVPACIADLDDSGVVDFADILLVLAAWGPCGGCPEDVDGDDMVGFADVLAVLAAWGPCV